MAKFTLEIEMGNAAMLTFADLAQATKRMFSDFSRRPEQVTDEAGGLYDINGNIVGSWSVEGADDLEDEDEDDESEDDEDEEDE